MYIYQRLKDLREDLDMTQADVAPILKTTREQYSRWERGAQEIPFHHVITLAEYYNVSIDYIAGLTNLRRDPNKFIQAMGRVNRAKEEK